MKIKMPHKKIIYNVYLPNKQKPNKTIITIQNVGKNFDINQDRIKKWISNIITKRYSRNYKVESIDHNTRSVVLRVLES